VAQADRVARRSPPLYRLSAAGLFSILGLADFSSKLISVTDF
jgi:hypothetical protein